MRRAMRTVVALMLCWSAAVLSQAPLSTAEFERRELAIAAELRCLVCQNQSIAESNAELARDLRNQIREQLKAGTVLLWFGPFVLLALGALVLARIVRSRRAGDTLSEAERARAAKLLGRGPEDRA